jgi:hypothetical protein
MEKEEEKTVPMTLEEEIAELNHEIEGYETLFNKAIAEGNEKYIDLYSKRAANLQPPNEKKDF